MFVNIYAGELPIRKTCNLDKPLNSILKVMDGCNMHVFCLESIKSHIIRMLELQPSPFLLIRYTPSQECELTVNSSWHHMVSQVSSQL